MGLPRPAKAQHFAAQTLVTNQTVDLPELPGIELLMMHRWAVLSLTCRNIFLPPQRYARLNHNSGYTVLPIRMPSVPWALLQ